MSGAPADQSSASSTTKGKGATWEPNMYQHIKDQHSSGKNVGVWVHHPSATCLHLSCHIPPPTACQNSKRADSEPIAGPWNLMPNQCCSAADSPFFVWTLGHGLFFESCIRSQGAVSLVRATNRQLWRGVYLEVRPILSLLCDCRQSLDRRVVQFTC